MSSRNDRIVVVGAGPVGLTAALALARRNIPTVLLTAEPEPVMELRGSTFHPPTLDLLDEFGIVPQMIEVGLKAPTWQFRDRETGPVATFDLSLLADDTNHPYRVQCEQWKLHALPRRGAAQDSGSRTSATATRSRRSGRTTDKVTVTAQTASGPVEIAGPLCDRRRRRAQRGAPLARHRVRRLHLSGTVLDRLDRLSVRADTDRHRLCELHRRSAGMAGAAAGAGPVARAGAGARAFRPRPTSVRRAHAKHAATRGAAVRAVSRSRIARSITCISGWRRASATAAWCLRATPRMSTIRSAAWA